MNERKLSPQETKAVYELYQHIQGSVAEKIIHEKKHSEIVFEHDGKEYRLIYDRGLEWFLDIAFVTESR